MLVSYKYKVYTSERNRKTENLFRIACNVYNHSIALIKRYYALYGIYLGRYRLEKHYTKLKRQANNSELKLLSSSTIAEILERIDKGYQLFFNKKIKRTPTFKSLRLYKSITFKKIGWRLKGNEFTIQKIKLKLKFSLSREVDGVIRRVTIKRDRLGNLWLVFLLDRTNCLKITLPKTGKTAGIKLGLGHFATSSDEKFFNTPPSLKKYLKELKKRSGTLSRRIEGSKNRERARLALARLYSKIIDVKEAFQWRLAYLLVTQYDILYLQETVGSIFLYGKKRGQVLAFNEFMKKVQHLSDKYGKKVYIVNRYCYTTSTCFTCGKVNQNILRDRVNWRCQCGVNHNIAINAAKNIFKVGTSTFVGETVMPI